MVIVAERDRLLVDHALVGAVGRALEGHHQPHRAAGREYHKEDAEPGVGIGGGMEDLCHDVLRAVFSR